MATEQDLEQAKGPRGQIALCAQFAFVRNLRAQRFPDQLKEAEREALSRQLIAQLRTCVPDLEEVTDCTDDLAVSIAVAHLTPSDCRKAGYALLRCRESRLCGQTIWCEVMSANHLTFSVTALASDLPPRDYPALTEALQAWVDALEPHFGFARTERLGYLTRQLTLTGSGFRLRVWLHLAGLMHFGHLQELQNAADFSELRIDTGDDNASQPPPGALCILFNGRTLRYNAIDETRALGRFLAGVIAQERNARARLLSDEPFILLDIVSRLHALFHASLMMNPEETCDCLSDFYLAWDLGVITPKRRSGKLPPMTVAELMGDDRLAEGTLEAMLQGVYLPSSVEEFSPWLKAAARANWLRQTFAFSISRSLIKRAMA